MKKNTPFIKNFKTNKNFYIYDVNTNRILLVNKIMNKIIPLLESGSKNNIYFLLKENLSKEDFEKNFNKIKKMQLKYNLFSSHIPTSRGYRFLSDDDFIREEFNKEEIQSLCLEATQQCNLRCKYCAYSGKYALSRIHTSSYMSFSIAKKAIDFYFSKGNRSRKYVSFYGGEPLLRPNFIMSCVDYLSSLKSKNRDIDLSIRISTNGTLLNENLMDFFIKNNIDLQISLDGPKRQHNKYRIYKNGNGSYDNIMKNLKILYKKSSAYFNNKVFFNCVVTPTSDLLELDDFFSKNLLTKNNRQLINFVNKKDTTFFDDCEHNITQNEELKFLFKEFMAQLIVNQRQKFSIFNYLFMKPFINIHKRFILDEPSSFVPIQGPCFPGQRKLYVSHDGKFHICERINPHFPIGDIENGFSFNNIKKILHEFSELVNEKDCLECWAMHFCSFCFASVANYGYMELSNKKDHCQKVKKYAINDLKNYASALEMNPSLAKKWDEEILLG